jgi:predicted RNase H-like HicB family nuclease
MNGAASYAYVIERADDGAFWAYLPDLPGCTSTGESAEEVQRNLPEALSLYLSYYQERGLKPPPPQARVGTLNAA